MVQPTMLLRYSSPTGPERSATLFESRPRPWSLSGQRQPTQENEEHIPKQMEVSITKVKKQIKCESQDDQSILCCLFQGLYPNGGCTLWLGLCLTRPLPSPACLIAPDAAKAKRKHLAVTQDDYIKKKKLRTPGGEVFPHAHIASGGCNMSRQRTYAICSCDRTALDHVNTEMYNDFATHPTLPIFKDHA